MSDEQLTQIVRKHCERLEASGSTAISAREVAEGAYAEIDSERTSPLLVQASCKNDLRRRAESALRTLSMAEQDAIENQGDMFNGRLQSRYPCNREDVSVYVSPPDMTDEELAANVARLRKEADAKSAHADALEAYGANRNSIT